MENVLTFQRTILSGNSLELYCQNAILIEMIEENISIERIEKTFHPENI